MSDLSDHPHYAFGKAESAALEPDDWDRWIAAAEKSFGGSLDGNQETDGFSLDFAHDAFKTGKSVAEYLEGLPAQAAPFKP